MLRYHCDICGKEVEQEKDLFKLNISSNNPYYRDNFYKDENEDDVYLEFYDELCKECVIKLRKILRIE